MEFQSYKINMIGAASLLLVLLSLTSPANSKEEDSFCWKPGSNPFYGQPRTERLASDKVKIDWSEIFSQNNNCQNVDFLIKSNPRHSPSDYKLSDFTLKGQTSATLMVTDGEDFVFQVIAREDKRPKYGIEYKYSQMVTSYFREETMPAIGFRELSSTEKLRITRIRKTTTAPSKPISTTTIRSTTPLYKTNKNQCRSHVKRIDSNHNLSNKILTNFIAYMTQNSARFIQEFMREKKQRCASSNEMKGFVFSCPKTQTLKCCSSPLGGQCNMSFAECDGGCIPQTWISDDWPDCMDGTDEPELESMSGLSLVEKMLCITCGGNIQAAVGLCEAETSNDLGHCVRKILGGGNCEPCISEYLQ